MNEREHAVLSLFYDEGNRELTPSFLAYRMRMSTRDATKLLDGMVKSGTLDLHVDDEGHIGYRLPPSERERIRRTLENRRQQGQSPTAHSAPSNAGPRRPPQQQQPAPQKQQPRQNQPHQNQRPFDGTDAQPGRSPQNPSAHTATDGHRQSGHDGTDGSVRHSRNFSGATSGIAGTTRASTSGSKQAADRQDIYDDWYTDDGHPQQPQHAPHHSQQGRSQQGRTRQRQQATAQPQQGPDPSLFAPGQYGRLPDHQSLTPYQQQQAGAHPARSQGRPGRIPLLAGALSLLMPGLGQFYNGEIGKGIMLWISTLFLWVFLLFWIVWIWSIIDAYVVAEQANQRALANESGPNQHPFLTDQRSQGSNPNSNAA